MLIDPGEGQEKYILPSSEWGREPPDAISLCYAVMSMHNTSKCAFVIHEVFLNLGFKFKEKSSLQIFYIFALEVSQRWEVFINYHK